MKQVLECIAKELCKGPFKIYETTLIEEGEFFSFATLMLSHTSFPKITVIQKAEIDEDVPYTILPYLPASTSDFGF